MPLEVGQQAGRTGLSLTIRHPLLSLQAEWQRFTQGVMTSISCGALLLVHLLLTGRLEVLLRHAEREAASNMLVSLQNGTRSIR